MKKLEIIKHDFRYIDGEPDILSYGAFRGGVTSEEITKYIQARANKLNVKRLIKKFNDIAGCNSVTSFRCEKCGNHMGLTYRHDVLRFADVLFGKTKSTYFD